MGSVAGAQCAWGGLGLTVPPTGVRAACSPSAASRRTAIRTGNVLVIVSGSPGHVDAHPDGALHKAQHAR
ncbi:hypothetical protein AB0I98_48845 [Streptomyces sp. NPDC050211]|uniref:hypothetical protein n=1 Tax=Streptomyces sp. NPDC050211 TaxID=3154932 RepID=UPI0034305991